MGLPKAGASSGKGIKNQKQIQNSNVSLTSGGSQITFSGTILIKVLMMERFYKYPNKRIHTIIAAGYLVEDNALISRIAKLGYPV